MRKVYNIPAEAIAQALRGRGRKSCLELLAFAIAVKMYTPSSRLKNTTPYRIHKLFHYSMTKAKRLLEMAKSTGMFVYNEADNSLTAVSLRKAYEVAVAYGKFRTTAMNAVKIDIQARDNIRGTEIERQLASLLLRREICIKQREYSFNRAVGKTASSDSLPSLSIEYMSKAARLSCRQVIRRLNKIESECPVKRNRSRLERDDTGGNIEIGSRKFTRVANKYTVEASEELRRFVHIIYGHRKRLKLSLAQLPVLANSEGKVETIAQCLGF